jgi:hypothetical protein
MDRSIKIVGGILHELQGVGGEEEDSVFAKERKTLTYTETLCFGGTVNFSQIFPFSRVVLEPNPRVKRERSVFAFWILTR